MDANSTFDINGSYSNKIFFAIKTQRIIIKFESIDVSMINILDLS